MEGYIMLLHGSVYANILIEQRGGNPKLDLETLLRSSNVSLRRFHSSRDGGKETLCPDAGQEIIDKHIVGYGVYKYIQKELIRQYLW